jgi:hypothetical protein
VTTRPEALCSNCWRTYIARRPRPIAVRCWHTGAVATRTESGAMEVRENVSGWRLADLRKSGALL